MQVFILKIGYKSMPRVITVGPKPRRLLLSSKTTQEYLVLIILRILQHFSPNLKHYITNKHYRQELLLPV